MKYPILEFDPQREAVIEPQKLNQPVPGMPSACVACFFQDIIAKLVRERNLEPVAVAHSEMGDHPFYALELEGHTFTLFHPGLGAPLAAGLLEEAIARGCRVGIACGGAGVLDGSLTMGHVIVPTAALHHQRQPAGGGGEEVDQGRVLRGGGDPVEGGGLEEFGKDHP